MKVTELIKDIRTKTNFSQTDLANILGTSLVAVNRWENGSGRPSPAQRRRLEELHHTVNENEWAKLDIKARNDVFASRGVSRCSYANTLFDHLTPTVELDDTPAPPILNRLMNGDFFSEGGRETVDDLLAVYREPAPIASEPPPAGMSAGKNSYTYDAHTYHTKVPPQGIAELLAHYLPEGGLVFDPFAGSGMTGVACRVVGHDCILNELSPAACFIADRFTTSIDPALFEAGVQAVLDNLTDLRQRLYTTECRECRRPTEILYTIWSYQVICSRCGEAFLLWDHARKYGQNVRQHKILSRFPCPACNTVVKKSYLERAAAYPVRVVYKCCQKEYKRHPLVAEDVARIKEIELSPPFAAGFYPTNALPDGINLRQPKKHGLDSIDKFYTPRNLAAMSHLWRAIHRVTSKETAAFLAFTFTSLYQRVTRLSEFRFWGGSGNMARFNVPFVFKEANVFDTFARKARTIQDHLQATASNYHGRALVVRNSATNLHYLPDHSVDLIFTDPPFGANINYSEMNILWESWLGAFTDNTEEAIMNKFQGKDVAKYQELMRLSLAECYRVLRPEHWMLLVFMNSSQKVWEAFREAITEVGFRIVRVDIFDKQHATFKQLVSDNTAGADLVLHCYKPRYSNSKPSPSGMLKINNSLEEFLDTIDPQIYINEFIHVDRDTEFDYRTLYSEWLSKAITINATIIDFAEFRSLVKKWLEKNHHDLLRNYQ